MVSSRSPWPMAPREVERVDGGARDADGAKTVFPAMVREARQIMTSRTEILTAVRRNRPEEQPLPDDISLPEDSADQRERFIESATAAGARLMSDREAFLRELAPYQSEGAIASTIPDLLEGTLNLTELSDPHDLQDLTLFLCGGEVAVAENGAIWLPESNLGHRAAPFLTQHLAVVVSEEAVVSTMHDAYARIDISEEGFGVFVAGPSKTADIEQSLVMGAHGPKSLTLLLERNES